MSKLIDALRTPILTDQLRDGFNWLEMLAEQTGGITITVNPVDGEIALSSGLGILHKHVDLAELCAEQAGYHFGGDTDERRDN